MSFIKKIPLFALLLILYNAVAFAEYYQPLVSLDLLVAKFPLSSGREFSIDISQLLLISGVAILYLELLKSTRTTKPYLMEHMLSMLVFLIFVIEFFMVYRAGNITFLLLGIMSLLDVIGGFTVTISRHVVLPGTSAAMAIAAADAAEAAEAAKNEDEGEVVSENMDVDPFMDDAKEEKEGTKEEK
ncbi:MAG: hypothetical protein HQL70_11695 [Magnetococcales bacterium]|nr:hypothetical protein [Magnetococcales bacterium]